MSLTPGFRIGPYEVSGTLGTGGMGEVYRARDTKLDRDVAIKVLPEAFAHDADRLARFLREAKTLAALNHPNIAAIYGLEDADGTKALVMELVEGDDLSQRVARGAIPIDEALPIAKQIADALEAAHEQGIIHRDLKPANIKVRPDGTVKVLDFGLAKAIESPSAMSPSVSQAPTITTPTMITGVGMILGTAAYMSPEQARGKPVDKRTDIWAFGCVLYEMLTGRRAFQGEDVSDTLAAVVKLEPKWEALPRDLPDAIFRLLRRALKKDARSRLGDIRDARLEMEDGLVDPAAPGGQPVPSTSSDTRTRWLQGIGIAVLAAITTIVAMLNWRDAPPDAATVRFEVATPAASTSGFFQLAPDGRTIVYVAALDGKNMLWARTMDSVAPQPLPGTDGASNPFWSPDSRSIGFFAAGNLKRVGLDGGPARTLTSGNPIGLNRGGAWSRDDVIVFAPTPTSGLFRIPASGGEAVPLTSLGSNTSHRFPAFLPDGQHFIYLAQRGTDGADIILTTLEAPAGTRLLSGDTSAVYAAPGYILFGSQGDLYAQPFDAGRLQLTGDRFPVAEGISIEQQGHALVSASASGTLAYRANVQGGMRQLVWFDRSGKSIGVVGPPSQAMSEIEISPDGRRVALIRSFEGGQGNDVWLADIARGVFSRITSSTLNERWPTWSPDGTRVAFEHGYDVPGENRIYVTALSGTQELLFQDKVAASPSDWSRDGRYVLYRTTSAATSGDLWVLPVSGDRKPFPFATSKFSETRGQFSPDGRWVAFESDESGRPEVYVKGFPNPGQQWQVSLDGGIEARWAPDGRDVYFISPDARMMSAAVQPSADGQSLDMATPIALFQTQIFRGGTQIAGLKFQYAIAPDGTRFLINSNMDDEKTSPITVILNWNPEAKK
jgi:serine/threonine protein kinase